MTTPTRNVLWHICQVIKGELALTDEQIWIYDQKRKIPSTTGLWVVVGMLAVKAFGAKSEFQGIEGGANELQSANFNATVWIDIQSRDYSAFDRKEEIILALNSIAAQRSQEIYAYRVGKLPSQFTNISEIEGAAIPYRFNLTFQVQYKVEKTKAVEYYDTFQTADVTTEA